MHCGPKKARRTASPLAGYSGNLNPSSSSQSFHTQVNENLTSCSSGSMAFPRHWNWRINATTSLNERFANASHVSDG
jgi:hypothetical protein